MRIPKWENEENMRKWETRIPKMGEMKKMENDKKIGK